MKTFIEIGAGSDGSWGLSLLQEGWNGWFVEAHPSMFRFLFQRIAPVFEKAKFICAAISDRHSIQKFSAWRDDFDKKDEAYSLELSRDYKRHNNLYKCNTVFYVPTITLSALLKTVGNVDVVRFDIEGEETRILQSYNWEMKPPLLCIEFHHRHDFSENQEILFTHGYEFVRVYGEDCIYRLKR